MANDELEQEPGGMDDMEAGLADTLEAMMNAIREAPVAQLVVSSITTLASAAYAKLESGNLPEAKTAIDAIAALLPVIAEQIEEPMRREFEQALTSLRLAYADAVPPAQ